MTQGPVEPAEPDEATAISRRRSIDPDATEPLAPDDLAPGERPGPQRQADAAAVEAESDDGSTIVVRRMSRPRSTRGAKPSTAAGPDAGPGAEAATGTASHRVAATPEATDAYPPRRPDPALVPRRAPSPRPPQALVDTAAGEAAAHRRRRRTALIAVAAASVFAVLIVAGIVALILIP